MGDRKEKRGDVHSFFDEGAEDYLSKEYKTAERSYVKVRHEKMLQYIDELKLPRDSLVLDAGCGPGSMIFDLLERGLRVYGIDLSEKMLNLARGNALNSKNYAKLSVAKGDIENLDFKDGFFDLIISAGVIEYLKTDDLALREFARTLRPGGVLITSITNKFSYINIGDFIIEPLKRFRPLLLLLNYCFVKLLKKVPVRPRHFRVRKHSPQRFRESLKKHGFSIVNGTFFYFSLLPRPFSQLFPFLTELFNKKLEKYARTRIGLIGEGYIIVCKKEGLDF